MQKLWKEYGGADAFSDPSPQHSHTHVPLTCLSRASHVFVDVDAAQLQLLTFLLRAGNAWVTTAVGFLQQKKQKYERSLLTKFIFHPINSIYAISKIILSCFTELINVP